MFTLNLFRFRSFDVYVNCEILAIPAKYDFKPYAYGFQKDSPFLPLFNYYLKEMKEKGSLKQIQTKYDPQPQFCPDFSGKPLGVGAVFTAFGVLFFGICAALILFCLEKILHVLGKFILSYEYLLLYNSFILIILNTFNLLFNHIAFYLIFTI